MSLTLLDFILFGIMLISGVLALMRGFTREALSLVAWGVAAIAAYFAIQQQVLIDFAMTNVPYLDKLILAQIGVGATAFILVLIIVSVISVKISDYVVDSAAGAFDRTLGFVFGIARGLVFVAICYIFYVEWLSPKAKNENWIKNAFSLPLIEMTNNTIFSLLPLEIQNTLRESSGAAGGEGSAEGGKQEAPAENGYKNSESQSLDNLIQGTGGDTQQPAFGKSNGQ